MTAPTHDLSKLRIDRDPPPAVRKAFGRTLALVVVAVLLVIGAVVWARSRSAATVETTVATPISTGGGAGGGAATSVTANGYVVARIRAAVSAKVAGRLASLTVDGGSDVKRGQVIARLENADYAAAVAEAEANLASTRAQVVEAMADRDQLEREARRTAQIHGESPELISAQEVEAARSRADQAAARATAAQARVQANAAALRVAEATLENTNIRAPFTGTVLRKDAEVGEVVAPSVGGGLTRGAVVTMADLTTLEVEVDVNEAYIARVEQRPGGQHHARRLSRHVVPGSGAAGRADRGPPAGDGAGEGEHRGSRPADPAGDGCEGGFPRAATRPGGSAGSAAPAARGSGCRPRPCGTRAAGSVVWLVRDGKLAAREVEAGPVSGGFREITRRTVGRGAGGDGRRGDAEGRHEGEVTGRN